MSMKPIVLIIGRLIVHLPRGVLVLMAGAFIFHTLGCGGPPLKPWHTARLRAEFTVHKAAEVRTFDDYRQLEDKLFAELEEKVYARTESGPEYGLFRYSSGSAADPKQRKPNWNRSIELPTDTPVGGALLLHGMSDSPYSFRALAKTLNQHDYWVIGLRLPGHGTAPSGLTRARWQDMAAAVQLSMKHLALKVGRKPIHIVGYSTGAALAVNFALDALEGRASPAPASLVLVSPAINVHPAAALAGFKAGMAVLPGLRRLAYLQILPEFDPYKYNSFATNAGYQVHRLTRSIARRIRSRAQDGPIMDFPPTLVLKSTVDATVTTDAVVESLLRHLAANRNELVLFDINRRAVRSTLLISDPGPLTARLMADRTLPFAVTLITNETPESTTVVSRHKPPFSAQVSKTEPLTLTWPPGVISLSHVALPIPPEDPLYGQRPPGNKDALFLGQMDLQGERGLLKIPYSWLVRLRHNPFYPFLETRVLDWIENAKGQTAPPSADR
jgi:alpha-beta hydrolase superfamily lysophospholipase